LAVIIDNSFRFRAYDCYFRFSQNITPLIVFTIGCFLNGMITQERLVLGCDCLYCKDNR
jgi:hypothetical protein